MLLDLRFLWEGPPAPVAEVVTHHGAGRFTRPFVEPRPYVVSEDELLALADVAGLSSGVMIALAADERGRAR